MRIDIFLNVTSINATVDFYVNELRLFEKVYDYGSDNLLLRYKYNKSFFLSTVISKELNKNKTLFALIVKDCKKEYSRIKKIQFSKAKGITPVHGDIEFLESPIGKQFYISDPDNNEFIIFQDDYGPDGY